MDECPCPGERPERPAGGCQRSVGVIEVRTSAVEAAPEAGDIGQIRAGAVIWQPSLRLRVPTSCRSLPGLMFGQYLADPGGPWARRPSGWCQIFTPGLNGRTSRLAPGEFVASYSPRSGSGRQVGARTPIQQPTSCLSVTAARFWPLPGRPGPRQGLPQPPDLATPLLRPRARPARATRPARRLQGTPRHGRDRGGGEQEGELDRPRPSRQSLGHRRGPAPQSPATDSSLRLNDSRSSAAALRACGATIPSNIR
jgi:hypothetical protein